MKRSGLSTYISVLLLIVVVTAGGLLVYGYFMGMIGDTPDPGSSTIFSIDSIVCNTDKMIVYLRNTGSDTGTIDKVYVDDKVYSEDKCTCILGDLDSENTVQPTDVLMIALTPNQEFQAEHTYMVKIVTTNGQINAQSVKCETRDIDTRYTKQTCYWPIDEDTGTQASNPPNPTIKGTITGATIVTGVSNEGIQFTNPNDHIYVDDAAPLDLTTTGTLEAWIYVISHNDFAGIIHKGEKSDFSDESYTLQFWNSDGTVRLGIFQPGDYVLLDTVSKLNTEEWYHVVGTWNSTTLALYINGELDNETPNTMGAATPSNGGLVIGAQLTEDYNPTYKRFVFNGIIDEPAIYTECLDESEIKARYNALAP